MEKHSKRNKSKDNPYTLSYNKITSSYVVEFKDNKNIIHKVEVSDKVFNAFDKFELEDISQMHEYERHIEHSEVYEETLNSRMLDKPISLEEKIDKQLLIEKLREALETLSIVQKRRIKMYFFEDMNLREIAEKEGCSIMSVKESIDSGITKLQKKLKN